jgi:hypothetical protein
MQGNSESKQLHIADKARIEWEVEGCNIRSPQLISCYEILSRSPAMDEFFRVTYTTENGHIEHVDADWVVLSKKMDQ